MPERRPNAIDFDAVIQQRLLAQLDREAQFRLDLESVLPDHQQGQPAPTKRVLWFGAAPPMLEAEAFLLRSLQLGGAYVKVVQRFRDIYKGGYYGLLSVEELPWEVDSKAHTKQARQILDRVASLEDLRSVAVDGVRVGGHALATAQRQWRIGKVELTPVRRRELVSFLAGSLAAASSAKSLLVRVNPDVVVVTDTAYTPKGELFDACIEADVPVVRWFPSHRSSAFMLKRYSRSNQDADLNSLANDTWGDLSSEEWTEDRQKCLQDELDDCYRTGDWYAEAGTQLHTSVQDPETVRAQLQLPLNRKVVGVFPHIGWDASFGRGLGLFPTYDEWLSATLRAACANDRVDWIVKVHPAHIGKGRIDGCDEVPNEEAQIRAEWERLPEHVHLLPAATAIATTSLLRCIDCCVTVRGTTGLEAACLGLPVVTGGAGRYSHRGFTYDSASADEYLSRLHQIESLAPLSPRARELANLYAYGLFVRRPLRLTSLAIEYREAFGAASLFNQTRLRLTSPEQWRNSPDSTSFAKWVLHSTAEDFLAPYEPL